LSTEDFKVSTTSTGFVEQIDNFVDKIPEYNPVSGDHFWAIASVYRWKVNGTGKTLMDHESLVQVTGPFCYYCAQLYSTQWAVRRCKGEPSEA
jgi:hypothetical protein